MAGTKDLSHQKIEKAAARLLRRDGIRGASVRRVMAAAGLTIGGFYAHFTSKERLLQNAFSFALRQKRAQLAQELGDARGAPYVDRFLRVYLTADHRDNPETGCPYAALLSELPRAGRAMRSRVREEFSRGLDRFVEMLGEPAPEDARKKAIAVLCLAFGALSMARALAGHPEGDEILAAAAAAAGYFSNEVEK